MSTWQTFRSVDQVAQQKGVNRRTVLRAIWRNELPALAIGEGRRKTWMIASITADRWLPRGVGRPTNKERSGQP